MLSRFIGKAIPMVSKNKNILMPMVIPMLQERQRMMDTRGEDWEDKPVRLFASSGLDRATDSYDLSNL